MNEKLLIVDDEKGVVDMLKSYFEICPAYSRDVHNSLWGLWMTTLGVLTFNCVSLMYFVHCIIFSDYDHYDYYDYYDHCYTFLKKKLFSDWNSKTAF